MPWCISRQPLDCNRTTQRSGRLSARRSKPQGAARMLSAPALSLSLSLSLSGASVASDPDPTGLAVVRAMEIAREQPQEALLQLHRAHLEAPGDARPTLIASRLLLSLGRPEDALAAIERTAEAGSYLMDVLHQKGVVLQTLGRAEEAAELFGRVLDQAPGHLPTLNDFAILLIDLGRTEEAKSLLDRAVEIDPNDPATRSNLTRLEREP